MSGVRGDATILIVEDREDDVAQLASCLEDYFNILVAGSADECLRIIREQRPQLILLNVIMPGMDGFELCELLKSNPETEDIRVIFVTAKNSEDEQARGFKLGAVDYITKPITPSLVRKRVEVHLSLVHAKALHSAYVQLIARLMRAAEFKDQDTGQHIQRISLYSKHLALASGWNKNEAEVLFHASAMHDIGKIGISDSILKKTGKLDDEEMQEMKNHCFIGASILGVPDSPLVEMASLVSLQHHEKWDGNGYPKGMSGENISKAGRIVALADVFDALTSERPYKKAWSIEKAFNFIKQERGKHFDPELVDILERDLEEFKKIHAMHQ